MFTVVPDGRGWGVSGVAFLGDNVPMTLADPRDGAIYAAIEHGHFGTKLHRSVDGGAIWDEIGVPAFPAPDKLEKIWALEPGHADEPGVLWCGTIPGGLFRSGDHGRTWTLVETLWNHPSRQAWFGGGADLPGIHSVCIDPRDSRRITLGVSCGGVWVSTDAGETWHCRADGMFAAYMPPERRDDPGPAPGRPVSRPPRTSLGTASQRHLPIDRRLGKLARSP